LGKNSVIEVMFFEDGYYEDKVPILYLEEIYPE
jgi:hypothetical protein